MRNDLHLKRRKLARALGAAYVEVLVIVGVVVTLGLAAILTLGDGMSAKADKQAECIKTFGCGAGSSGSAQPLAAVVGNPGEATGGTQQASTGGGGGFWSGVGHFAYGFGAEAVGTVTGLYQTVRHPIQTAEGLAFVVQHPVMTWDAIRSEWAGRSTAENLGRGVFQLATIIGPGAITKVSKAAEVANAARVAEEAVAVERAVSEAAAAERLAAAERTAAESRAARAAEEARCPGGVCDVPGNCFAAGTPVLTPSGERSIESVAVGDVVIARDPLTGATRQEHVSRLFVTPDREVVDLELTPDALSAQAAESAPRSEHLTVTPEHPFYAEGRGFLTVSQLELGMHVTTASGTATVASLKQLPTKITVYNFEVEDAHTYFVGHTAAWVHNTCNRPPDLTPEGAGRSGALNEAKRRNNIPTSSQPESVTPNYDRRGNLQPGRTYNYRDSNGKLVSIREDAAGHVFPDNPSQNRGPHFNDPAGNHYDFP